MRRWLRIAAWPAMLLVYAGWGYLEVWLWRYTDPITASVVGPAVPGLVLLVVLAVWQWRRLRLRRRLREEEFRD